MLKNNIKKIIVSLIAVLLIVGVANIAFATEGEGSILDEINNMLQEGNEAIDENESLEEIPEGENKNTNINTNINTNTNTNTNTNVNENRPATTPHAGLEDYSGLIFIAVFAVSAIYAYKKVREYNG